MTAAIKIAAVSYLNTKPLLYGLEQKLEKKSLKTPVDLSLEHPNRLAQQLQDRKVDLGLVPVAAIPDIPDARIVSDFGIGADGPVASVAIYSRVPLQEVQHIYLDYQSRTSVRLAQLLIRDYWKLNPEWLPAPENFIDLLEGTTAGVIIGDRALENNARFPFVYDLAEHWKQHTGMPFIFAAWVANKDLPETFLNEFEAANELGLRHLEEIIRKNPFPHYDLFRYYTKNIQYRLSPKMHRGKDLFLEQIRTSATIGFPIDNE